MFEPFFCFMDMFISIQCKWSNKNHFQLRHITDQTSFCRSSSEASVEKPRTSTIYRGLKKKEKRDHVECVQL